MNLCGLCVTTRKLSVAHRAIPSHLGGALCRSESSAYAGRSLTSSFDDRLTIRAIVRPHMDPRLRLSLLARMLFTTVVLASLSLVLAAFAAVVGVMLLLLLSGLFASTYDVAVAAPRLSVVIPVPPSVVAAGALSVLAALVFLWTRYDTPESPVPASALFEVLSFVVLLFSLYLVALEGVVALGRALSGLLDGLHLLALFVVLSLVGFVVALRTEVRKLRQRSVAETSRPARETDDVTGIVRRLAQLADVPTPDVRVSDTDRPVAFTVGSGASAAIVVSTGLLALLPRDELTAVLAHEVSHLANGDSRLMTVALAPVVYAEGLVDDDPEGVAERLWWLLDVALLRYGQFGVAVLSRGREWAADAGAVALTGSPAALASALVRLDDARGAPQADLRAWSDALAALDVLPTLSPDGSLYGWAFSTHPSTAERIERLRRLEATAERQSS